MCVYFISTFFAEVSVKSAACILLCICFLIVNIWEILIFCIQVFWWISDLWIFFSQSGLFILLTFFFTENFLFLIKSTLSLFGGNTGGLTQDFILAKQALYHLSHSTSPLCLFHKGSYFLEAYIFNWNIVIVHIYRVYHEYSV
jgi:hypothetical protein